MSTRCRALGLPVVWLFVAGCATPIEEQSWLRVETAHFELVSSASPERTVAMARELERFRSVVMTVTTAQEFDPRVPTRMYVFRDDASFSAFKWRRDLGGYVLPTLQANYMVVNAAATKQQPMSTIFHEYVHFVMRNQGALHYPLWYGEGLAEYLSTAEFEEDLVYIGKYPEIRGQWLVSRNLLPLRDVLYTESLDDRRSSWSAMFYAQSWALMHYLILGSERAGKSRRGQGSRYVALLNRGVSRQDAIADAFGDLQSLEKELRAYIAEGQMPYEGWSASRFPAETSARPSPVPLSRVQLELAELQLLLAANDRDHLNHARQLVGRILEVDPQNARARIVQAWIRGREGGLTAQELDDAVGELPDDPFTAVRAGDLVTEVLRSTVMMPQQRRELVGTARRLYRRALELDPESPAAHAGLGATYLFEQGDPLEGIQALEEARSRVRWSTEVALLLARLYMRTDGPGQRRAADLLEEVLVWSHDPREGQQARELLAELSPER